MTVAGRRPRARCPFPFPLALVVAAALVALPAASVEIRGAAVVSSPGADDTYAMGDEIEVAVSFDGAVYVTHSPSLTFTLQIGSVAQPMRFVDGSGTSRLLFRYRVQEDDEDPNGISFGTDALGNGTLADGRNGRVELGLPAALDHDDDHKVDAVAPSVTGPVRIVSRPGDDGTYAAGDHIDLELSFSERVVVSGAPELLISVGNLSRGATLLDVRPQRLTFRYIVQSGDLDTEDGISVEEDALRGGTIEDAFGNPAKRTLTALADSANHKVDAIEPQVEGAEITSNAGDDDTYVAGDAIEVSVTFDEIVHVTTPCTTATPVELQLLLSVGERTRAADLVGGSGTRTLRFRYVVQAGDLDDDGISVGPTALQGGCLRDHAGNLPDRSVPPVPAQAAHKVNAGGTEPPKVTEVEIVSTPQAGATYATGEAITVEVTFDKQVHVTGEPVLTLSIGAHSRDAAFATGGGTTRLEFRYVVQEGDLDEDGISIAPNALRGGVIEDSVGNAAVRTFPGLPADSGHGVRGIGSLQATLAIVSAPRSGDTYGLEEDIEVTVTFAGVVHVTGDPVLDISIGGNTRTARFTTGSGTRTLRFRYTVQAGDLDEDGISIASGALRDGEITSGPGGVVGVYFQALPAQPRHKVNGIVAPRVTVIRFISQPASGDTYGPGEQISLAVVFDADVHVTGNPVLAVSVGPNTRSAEYVAGSGTGTLTFRYTVQEGDVDADGVSVAANALSGGAIAGASGDPVSPIFAGLPAQRGHRVDAAQPVVAEVRIVSSPGRSDTYDAGEAIDVSVTFNEVVHVTGDPVLTLSLGGGSRQAALASGSGTETLLFRYTVREDDLDRDGISIAANALTGGVIQDGLGNAVDRTFAALPAARGHKVDATSPAARVLEVGISSRPAAAGTYAEGEGIEITVTFDRAVHVTGDPVLTLSVGGRSRAAGLVSGSGTPALVFRYVVQTGDVDDDGVSVAANALSGGTIEDGDGKAADLGFEALEAQDGHRVGPEIQVDLDVPALSVGTPWARDLEPVLAQVGAGRYGALVARSESPALVSAHVVGTVVTVTPHREGVGMVVVTATNARLVLSLAVTVGASTAEKAVLGDALATIGRGLLWSATNTIGTRLDMAGDARTRPADVRYAAPESGLAEAGWPTGGPEGGMPGAMNAHPDAPGLEWQTTGYPTQRDFGFEMPLIGIGSQAVSWGVWGGGDYWAFDSEPEAGAYDGDMTSGYLGVDARGEAWVAGVAVSHAQADVSYEFGGDAPGAGTLETDLTTVHPYVQWSPHERARLWAILGFGTGEALAVRDGENAGPPADLSMSMGVAGLRFDLGSPLGVDLAVRGDAGFAELETGDGLAAVEDLSVGVHQVRLGVEGSWPLQLGGSTLVPFVDIGGRFDGGDGQTGGALEVAGGVRFRSPNVGVELKGRTVAMHAVEGYSESGLSAAIVVGPSMDGRGWSLSLAPRWGGAADMTDMLWRRDYRRGMGGLRHGWGLAGRVGYGAGFSGRPGLVTSFGEFDLSERDRRRVRFGVSYRLPGTSWQPPVYLELAGERVEIYPVETDHRLVLTGRAHF